MSFEVNFARLNHILIPKTRADRDRLRNSRIGRALRPVFRFYELTTIEGGLLFTLIIVVGLLALDVEHGTAYLLWCALTGLLTAAMIFAPRFRLASVRVEVRAPPRVTVGEEISFALSIRNDGNESVGEVRANGPFLPWDGRWTAMPGSLASVAANGSVLTTARARFIARGEHHLDPFRIGRAVPLGLALGPNVYSAGCRFVVVPRIANVARIAMQPGQRHQRGGVTLASNTGESLELRGVRPYRAGDPLRDLHAKSWARTGQPMVREYQQEYYARIGVVLDVDETAATESRRESAISLAAGIVSRLARGDAVVDLLVAGATVHHASIGRSTGTFEHALDVLGCVEPTLGFDAQKVLARIAAASAQLSTIVVILVAWDPTRCAFLDQLESLGAGVRALLVTSKRSATAPDPRVRIVQQWDIEKRELSL